MKNLSDINQLSVFFKKTHLSFAIITKHVILNNVSIVSQLIFLKHKALRNQ